MPTSFISSTSDPLWDTLAASWDDDPIAQAFQQKVWASLNTCLDWAQLPKAHVDGAKRNRPMALDIGCGTGALTEHLLKRGLNVTALDVSKQMLDRMMKRCKTDATSVDWGEVTPYLGKIEKWATRRPQLFKPQLSLAVAASVMSFVDDITETLTAIRRLMLKGGLFIQWEWANNGANLDLAAACKVVSEAGFKVIRKEVAFSLRLEPEVLDTKTPRDVFVIVARAE